MQAEADGGSGPPAVRRLEGDDGDDGCWRAGGAVSGRFSLWCRDGGLPDRGGVEGGWAQAVDLGCVLQYAGRVFQRHNGDVACDHYNRLEADLDLIASLGVGAYRFSIAWPRILPDGTGAVNGKGLDFYERLVDGLKARGIKAFATLYHWDLPLMLAGDGGWTARATAEAFADYARIVTARLGDRLDAVATFNEPWCSVWLSHLYGIHAPGERNLDAALHALHTTNLAHGLGVQAIRAERADLPVGIVLNAHSIYPGSDAAADVAAAERAHAFHNGVFFGPIFKGAYPTPSCRRWVSACRRSGRATWRRFHSRSTGGG